MVNIVVRAGTIIAGLLIPLVLWGCSSPAERSSESVGESRQAVVAAESKRFSVSLPTGVLIGDQAAAAGRTLTLADRARVQAATGTLLSVANSGTSSGGTTELGVEARSGTILSKPPVTLRDRSRVEGNVQSGGAITRQNQTVVTGTTTANSSPSFDPWSWTVSFPAASQSVTVPPDSSATINPGSFENVTVFSRSVLRLRTGTYYLKSFDLEPQAQILVDTLQGPVFVYVRSGLIWRGATNFTGPSDRLLVGFGGTDSVALECAWQAQQKGRRRPTRGPNAGNPTPKRQEL